MLKRLFNRLFGTNKKDLPVVPVVSVSLSTDKDDANLRARAALVRTEWQHKEATDRVLLKNTPSPLTRTRPESRRLQKSTAEDDSFLAVTMMGYGGVHADDDYHCSGTDQSSSDSGHSTHSRFANGDDSSFGGDGGCDGGGGGDGGGD